MISLRIEHANPVWDRHIVVFSDSESMMQNLFPWVQKTLDEKKETIACYGFSLDSSDSEHPEENNPGFLYWLEKTKNERDYQTRDYAKAMFAFTIFGEAKHLVGFSKELEKEIVKINGQTKARR